LEGEEIMKAILLSIVASIALLPASSLAHTHLLRSSPVENAVLAKSPPVATLVFAEPVTLTAVKIESTDGGKTAVKPLPANPAAEASVALPTLALGRYKMSWRAISEDGHIMSGEIHFTIGEKDGSK
jgi:methionine-rich copper-binding protein CopC